MRLPLSDPWLLAVRARRLLARPLARRGLALAVALATGLTVLGSVRSAEQAREAWGATRTVAVARRDLDPGDTVGPAMVELRAVPAGAVADAALSDVPVGAVVRQAVVAGEPLVADRLAPRGLTGVAALVPEGHRAVAVPIGPAGVPPLVVGDEVDVVAVVPPQEDIHGHSEAEAEETTDPVATIVERATVVDVSEQAVSIAVPVVDAPAVAAVLAGGIVLLALAGA